MTASSRTVLRRSTGPQGSKLADPQAGRAGWRRPTDCRFAGLPRESNRIALDPVEMARSLFGSRHNDSSRRGCGRNSELLDVQCGGVASWPDGTDQLPIPEVNVH